MPAFKQIVELPPDPIYELQIVYAHDLRNDKINLSIGTFNDKSGKPVLMPSVKEAEKILLADDLNKGYSPIIGNSQCILNSIDLIFGTEKIGVHTPIGFQTVGGTGALSIGLHFLSKHGFKTLHLPNETWLNHEPIAKNHGMTIKTYPYYDLKTRSLDFNGLKNSIDKMSKDDLIMLHACCHNPTGVDLNFSQWRELSSTIKAKGVFPFFDLAYQGFGENLTDDVFGIRLFASEGHELFVANSFSKNMSLYGERAGVLIVLVSAEEKSALNSQIKHHIRSTYSNPPIHPGLLVERILKIPMLRKQWEAELTSIREKINDTRKVFAEALDSRGLSALGASLRQQKGMFSLLELSQESVEDLRLKEGIYLAPNGRINLAAIHHDNVERIASAIREYVKN